MNEGQVELLLSLIFQFREDTTYKQFVNIFGRERADVLWPRLTVTSDRNVFYMYRRMEDSDVENFARFLSTASREYPMLPKSLPRGD